MNKYTDCDIQSATTIHSFQQVHNTEDANARVNPPHVGLPAESSAELLRASIARKDGGVGDLTFPEGDGVASFVFTRDHAFRFSSRCPSPLFPGLLPLGTDAGETGGFLRQLETASPWDPVSENRARPVCKMLS